MRSKLLDARAIKTVSKQVLLASAWDAYALISLSTASVGCGD
jgi:hypothetical protein